jgi:hypothetical protein
MLMAKRDITIDKIPDINNLSSGDHLEFEEKVADLDRQMNELRKLSSAKGIDYLFQPVRLANCSGGTSP